MRIVPDTNVLISATFWKGKSLAIINLILEKKIIGLTTNDILLEYNKVLHSEEIQNKTSSLTDTSLKIKSVLTTIESNSKLSICTDPDDNKILECAVDGKADFIITYDKHLLILKEYKKIKIITPEEL